MHLLGADNKNHTFPENWKTGSWYAGDVNDADVDFEFGTRKH